VFREEKEEMPPRTCQSANPVWRKKGGEGCEVLPCGNSLQDESIEKRIITLLSKKFGSVGTLINPLPSDRFSIGYRVVPPGTTFKDAFNYWGMADV
jgi:hypothetical protein